MSRNYSINKECDRCGATMDSVQLELDDDPAAKARAEAGKPVFVINFDGVTHTYEDVCPKCGKTLTRITSDAGPIQRSHSQGGNGGEEEGEDPPKEKPPKDPPKEKPPKDPPAETKGSKVTRLPPPRRPSRPGASQ